MFWTKDRIMSWYQAIFAQGTEVIHNLLCFAPHVHSYHERALFALQPGELSSDQKCQKIKFFWMTTHRHSSQQVDLLRRPEVPQAPDRGSRNVRLFDVDTETKICSGQEIDLITSDPARLPLPDKRILEMQWILQQVAALKGRAEPFLDDYSDDEGWQAVMLEDEKSLYVEEWILSTTVHT